LIAYYLAGIVAILLGLLLIVGTLLRWKFLVDPPERWATFYSLSKLKESFGSGFLVVFNFVIGTIIVLMACGFLVALRMGHVRIR
jgi:sulfite exporter TauE/SafE